LFDTFSSAYLFFSEYHYCYLTSAPVKGFAQHWITRHRRIHWHAACTGSTHACCLKSRML